MVIEYWGIKLEINVLYFLKLLLFHSVNANVEEKKPFYYSTVKQKYQKKDEQTDDARL